MTHDPLSDVLRSVRLRGAVFYHVSCGADWAAEAPPARDIAGAVMPGAEHVLAYHLIAKGAGYASLPGLPPARLASGDIVMFPGGDGHVLSSAPGMHARPESTDWVFATRHQPRPIPVSYHRGVLRPGEALPAAEAATVLLCGFIGCDLRPFNPLIGALPRMLHLPAGGDWVRGVLHQAALESNERRAGCDALLERLSEMVFIDAARRYVDTLPEDASGWLAGLRDRYVGKALALLHARPAEPWTIEALGRQVALSRSALHERFMRYVGQAPMQYLASWRMQLGANLLRGGHANVARIAQEVGYDSEAAFARAFKRATGMPPAAWRRSREAGKQDGGIAAQPH